MKNLFKSVTAAVMIPVLLMLTGCAKYASHYKAAAFVHSCTADSAFMSFAEFEGETVFKLKSGSGSDSIKYSASLESGSADVYYDINGTKTLMFSLKAGDSAEGTEKIHGKGRVYITVETSEPCGGGNFSFDIQ